MILPYIPGQSPVPVPSLGGASVRHRPIVSARIHGPHQSLLLDGQLDTGAEDTILPERYAPRLGLNLSARPRLSLHLAGRGVVSCRFAAVTLRITDGCRETYEWPAMIGFVAVPLLRSLWGHAGFLQFFDVTFRGAAHEVEIVTNASFPGRRFGITP